LLEELKLLDSEEATDGFKKNVDWAAEWGITPAYTRRLIKRGLEQGIIEKKIFRIATGSGVRPVPHYRKK